MKTVTFRNRVLPRKWFPRTSRKTGHTTFWNIDGQWVGYRRRGQVSELLMSERTVLR